MSNEDTSRQTNMDNISQLPMYDGNSVDSKSSFANSVEMNDLAPDVDTIMQKSRAPIARATVAKYALEKFENAHITIFQVK